MLYLIAIILPPFAVLFCGKYFQFFLCLILTLLMWLPGIIYALFIVSEHKSNERLKQLQDTIRGNPLQ